jgi:hypothetical protein
LALVVLDQQAGNSRAQTVPILFFHPPHQQAVAAAAPMMEMVLV